MNLHLIQYLFRWLTRVDGRLEQMERTVTELSADQAHEDADVAALNTSFDEIEAEVAALKAAQAAGQPLDFTGLDNVVARAKGDEPAPAPAPEPVPAPVTDPAAPPADGTPIA